MRLTDLVHGNNAIDVGHHRDLPRRVLEIPVLVTVGDASHVLSLSNVWTRQQTKLGKLDPVACTIKKRAGKAMVAFLYRLEDVQALRAELDGGPEQLELALGLVALKGGRS